MHAKFQNITVHGLACSGSIHEVGQLLKKFYQNNFAVFLYHKIFGKVLQHIVKLDQGRICGQMQDVSTGKGKSSYYSAMPRARGLKFYYVIADPKVGE